ncbi:PhoH family protein [Cupriavidus campinensis]|uniref:Phosphate starvation-inducible protein PhoH n=1 Tax=Cupriavidus campinensis TaxID=151783 RepID=A0ABY3ETT0_9BURK|nr:PhoH family protein [Cupriavidus campinensis]TSP13973.1 phosphate starvation-inducible protein PhoH [Cupriavidus campinensis]
MARTQSHRNTKANSASRPSKRQQRRAAIEGQSFQSFEPIVRAVFKVKHLEAKTENQQRYLSAIDSFELIFATGPAGTGKTFLAAAKAAEALEKKEIDQIVITRPAVEAGENLGFLPGELEEKFDPYLAPFKDALEQRMGRSKVEYLIKTGVIVASPLAYMRGKTFRRSFVILDEAQNTTPTQMKLFLTRIGEDCVTVVNGDVAQKDIRGESGLADAVRRLSWIPSVKTVEFTRADIVRSGLVQQIVEAYEEPVVGADAS